MIAVGFIKISYAGPYFKQDIIDKVRKRTIPIIIYEIDKKKKFPVVIINHGYTVRYSEYSFLANALNQQGYNVVSIQHDNSNDPPLTKVGTVFNRRKPMWERGVHNILFVISELEKIKPHFNLNKIILIGHSNGGDISMMFLDKHPKIVQAVISLDSLRYPFPINNGVKILSLRAKDTIADPGVIPERGIELINISNSKHMDFCDRGDPLIKQEILKSISQFLKIKVRS